MIKRYVPGCVKQIELRADGEFLSWEAVKALLKEGIRSSSATKYANRCLR
jgi:hypothetical protein